MMKSLLWLLALAGLAVAVTLLARLDQGYVIVLFPPWRMEVSFLLALLLLAAGYLFVNLILKLARTALSLPEDLRAWRERQRRAAADRALFQALAAHLDGDVETMRQAAARADGCAHPELLTRLRALKSIAGPPQD